MSETAEAGAALAWRLLATLEGGSLLLAASALLAYSARGQLERRKRPCKNVLVSNTTSKLGKDIKNRLESHGCTVSTVTGGAISGADSDIVDALVVVGTKPNDNSLNGISDVVTEDVHNIKLLESLSKRVNRGGYIAWACDRAEAEAGNAAFANTSAAFDTVLQASLQHVAKVHSCKPIWIGRCAGEVESAERIVAALMSPDTSHISGYSNRNAAFMVGKYFYRWLKSHEENQY